MKEGRPGGAGTLYSPPGSQERERTPLRFRLAEEGPNDLKNLSWEKIQKQKGGRKYA